MDRKRLIAVISIVLLIIIPVVFILSTGVISPRNNQTTNEGLRIPNRIFPPEEVDYEIVEVVTGLEVPWSIAFTSRDRFLVTERRGAIRVIENGRLRDSPLISFVETAAVGEAGLMGLTVDPEYSVNQLLYTALAYSEGNQLFVKVIKLIDNGDAASVVDTLIDRIPASSIHAGGRVEFGPDNKLYVTTGDAGQGDLAQDLDSLAGKILRINSDGSLPSDNPFNNSPVWSYGHRNPQGLAWHPESTTMYSTEHGPSGNDGPPGGDEINIIVAGGNYGWPLVSHERSMEGMISPILLFTPAEAPASAAFYRSDGIPQFKNNFFFGALRGEGLFRIVFSETDAEMSEFQQKLREINFGRIRAVAEGPDGALYFSTSNRDGRGNPRTGDDKIYKITPLQ